MTRLLFGAPGDWCDRHQGLVLGAIALLMLTAGGISDLIAAAVCLP